MSGCQLHHEIIVSNVNRDEVIEHQVIVIRGRVNGGPCNVRTGAVENRETAESRTFQLTKGNVFKVLWNLRSGTNRIQVNYCQTSVQLNIIHRDSESQYRVQPLYIICQGHDGHFNEEPARDNGPAQACKKISLGLKLVQCLYAEKIQEHGLGRRTFTLNDHCQIFRSGLSVEKARTLDENALWSVLAREILNSEFGADEKLKFVAFIGCTEYEKIQNDDFSYENIKRHTKAHANLGGGGLALFGSGYLYCWPAEFDDIVPCFESTRQIDLKNFLDDSNYRRTYGGCYATTVGAVCHELGHIFDLGHTEQGIMGSGFDYVNLVFTNRHLTEHLPNRIIDSASTNTAICADHGQKDRRLTAIKRPGQFLEKYHEQKTGDSTFFTLNCAIILSVHRWLDPENARRSDTTQIALDESTLEVTCTSSSLRLIEIRHKHSNLVIDYLNLVALADRQVADIRAVNLSDKLDRSRHSVFAITANGCTKFFA